MVTTNPISQAVRDDYPHLWCFAIGSSGRDRSIIARRLEARVALAEITRLRDGHP